MIWTTAACVLIAVLDKDCHSLYINARQRKANEVSTKHMGVEVGFASEASEKNIYIFSITNTASPTSPTSVLRWRPGLSQFYPGIQ